MAFKANLCHSFMNEHREHGKDWSDDDINEKANTAWLQAAGRVLTVNNKNAFCGRESDF